MFPKVMKYVGNKTREQLKPFHFEGLFNDEIGRAKTKKLFCFGAMETFIKKSHENLNYNLVLDNGYRKSSFKYGSFITQEFWGTT